MKLLLIVPLLILLNSCYTPGEGVVLRKTTGSAYKKGVKMRERVHIPKFGNP